jgi:hypothetical protein
VTERPLETDVLPLVLLASVSHPDTAFRERLTTRLDAAIEERRPLHTAEEVRQFLLRQPGTPLEPFYLDPAALEIAVQIIRLVFTRQTPKVTKKRVRIVSCEVFDDEGGLVVNHHLKPLYMERLAYARRLMRKAKTEFVAGMVMQRMEQFGKGESPVRTMCHLDDVCLRLTGEFPWDPTTSRTHMEVTALSTGQRLDPNAFQLERKGNRWVFRPVTPEAMIRFSAFLPRGERLVFRAGRAAGRVIVTMREFEDEAASMATMVSYGNVESWLRGVPAPALALEDEDRYAIAQWAYPPDSWLSGGLLKQLV